MRKPKLRELKEAVTAVLKGPYTSKFPKEPHVPPPEFRGKPVYDTEGCMGCGTCKEVCPANAIEITDQIHNGKGTRKLTLYYDRCIFCGQCQANCLTRKGIRLTNEYDLATLDRSICYVDVSKELAICEICGAVIGAVQHIEWIANKLGPAAYSNPTLMLASLQEFEHAGNGSYPVRADRLKRQDHIRLLCPRCRRLTVFVV
jgi:hydrogenase-4 component H